MTWQTKFHQLAIQAMKNLWYGYLFNTASPEFERVLTNIADDFVMIGTGKHEILVGAENIAAMLSSDQAESNNTQFEVMDEWYEAQALSDHLCLVYGGFYAREIPQNNRKIIADMDTRFTAVYRYEHGEAILCNLHHSVPNFDQAMGEYYPKTITEKANAAIEHSNFLEQQLKLDSLTGLYNRTATEIAINDMLSNTNHLCAFLMIDLDNFKMINDVHGHLQGDLFLRSFAEILKENYCHGEIVSRLGGDEFSVFINNTSKETVEASIIQLLQTLKHAFEIPISCTIGIAYNDDTNDFITIYRNADHALYSCKSAQKGSYTIYK